MSLASGLTLFAYDLAVNTGLRIDYGAQLEELSFTTVAPGGFGDLTCKLKVQDARNIPLELRMFSNIALMDPNNPNSPSGAVFLGRWDEPGVALDNQNGDLYNLHAMGASTCLKDDPSDTAYTGQTAQSILASEYTTASAYLLLDSDRGQVLPDAPASTFSPAFNGKTLEEKINELAPLLGDYQWAVWDHATHTDAAGFPTWQLYWHVRDTSTVSYTGYLLDENSYDIRPSGEYSYNVIQVKYRDTTTDAASSVTVSDTRLNGNGSQGSAPFPRRKLVKDLSSIHLSATETTSIANALLNQYQNGGFKVTAILEQVRDAYGNLIPLHQVRADSNIFLPELSLMGQTLPVVQTANTNVFYVVETEYRESSGQAPQLTITCNSFYDTAAFQIARMQYIHQGKMQDGKTHHTVRAAGESERGVCGVAWGGNALSTDTYEQGVNYKTALTATPTSISLTSLATSNARAPGTNNSQLTGFTFQDGPTANGAGFARYTYTTNGN